MAPPSCLLPGRPLSGRPWDNRPAHRSTESSALRRSRFLKLEDLRSVVADVRLVAQRREPFIQRLALTLCEQSALEALSLRTRHGRRLTDGIDFNDERGVLAGDDLVARALGEPERT